MELWSFQKEAVEFIGNARRSYLALDMGLGKTLTALSASASFGKKNILVIAEKNEIVNSENFRREVETHFGDTFQYISLRDEPQTVSTERVVAGINPDALVKLDPEYTKHSFDAVIVDEATLAKTTTTARFKAVRKVCKSMEYVVLLSGTPMMNGAAELYAPLLLLDHPLAGDGTADARKAFESIFAGGHYRKIKNSGIWYQDYVWWAKGANHVRELRYLIGDKFFFRRKEDSGMFKKKVRLIERVPMTIPWLVEYQAAWEEYLVKARKRDVNMDNVMELQRLIENGQLYQVNSKWKARRVVEDIAEGKYGKEPVLVFTLYNETEAQLLTEEGAVSYEEYVHNRDVGLYNNV